MKRIGIFAAALLCCGSIAACGRAAPVAPAVDAPSKDDADSGTAQPTGSDTSAQPGDEADSGAAKQSEGGTFIPPQNWCGTDRKERNWGVIAMGTWSQPDATGLRKRVFVRRKDKTWVFVTEWGKGRGGHFKTSEVESGLPDSKSVEPRLEQVLQWTEQLLSPDEERVFRAALALGTHRVPEAVRALGGILGFRSGHGNYARVAAAIGLGRIKEARCVERLLDGLFVDDALLRTAIVEALHHITGHTIDATASMPGDLPPEARERWLNFYLREEWGKWWRQNESAVTKKLAEDR